MATRAIANLTAAILVAVAVGCVPQDDPNAIHKDLHVAGFTLKGQDQTAYEGESLAEPVSGFLILSDGTYDLNREVHVTILSGSGTIQNWGGGATASGNGGSISTGSIGGLSVRWTLGPAAEPQTLRFWAIANDTVYADVTATCLPSDES